jgi:hypothetical protein
MSNSLTAQGCANQSNANQFKLVTTPTYSWTIQYGDSGIEPVRVSNGGLQMKPKLPDKWTTAQ